jgi:acyl-CoA thioester hydrolase
MIAAALSPRPFVHRLRVRYAECDMQGRVFNANYLTWFDTAHTELLREAFGNYLNLIREHGVDFVVAEVNVRYRAPAQFDDEVEIAVAFDEPTTSSVTSRFTVSRDGETLTEGALRHVCVDATSFAKAPWPDAVRAAFASYVVGAGPTRDSPSGA